MKRKPLILNELYCVIKTGSSLTRFLYSLSRYPPLGGFVVLGVEVCILQLS